MTQMTPPPSEQSQPIQAFKMIHRKKTAENKAQELLFPIDFNTGFKIQEFSSAPILQNADLVKQSGFSDPAWWFSFEVPEAKTTKVTFQLEVTNTPLSCRLFLPSTLSIVAPDEPDDNNATYGEEIGYAPDLSVLVNGTFMMRVKDELGQTYRYPVNVTGATGSACPISSPTPTPVPTPTATPSEQTGGPNGNGGGGGNGGGVLGAGTYSPKGDPKYSKCLMKNTKVSLSGTPFDSQGILRLAKIYDFDKAGADITFVFRSENSFSPNPYNMSQDPSLLLNSSEIGYSSENKNLRVTIPSYSNNSTISGDPVLAMEKALYDPKKTSDKGDNGSFYFDDAARRIFEKNPSKYPILRGVLKELDLKQGVYASPSVNEINDAGYFFVGVQGSSLYNLVKQTGKPAKIKITIGVHQLTVNMSLDPKTGAWVITCG